MIIKSLSRKSGSTGQLFNYLFRYMLNEEKRELLPEQLRSLVERAQVHASEEEFEESLQKEEILQYGEMPNDQSGNQETISVTSGAYGNGFYLSKNLPVIERDKKDERTGVVKKYVLDSKKQFFEAGKNNSEYYKLWKETVSESKAYTSLANMPDRIQAHLTLQGYAGIKTDTQTIVFDPKAITELPKDFFKHAREYFTKGKSGEKQSQFVLRHNISSRSVAGYVKEFEKNEANRIHKRKDSVQAYHTILSFSNKDKEQINEAVLRDMAKKYIELRGKDNLYVITSHHDKEHIHLHCAMSGTKLNGLSSRISRQEFANIKVALDAYQKEKYPQLVHSLPKHGKEKNKELSKEDALKNIKTERRTDKDILLKLLDDTYSKATSQEHFLAQLTDQGHIPYYRSGKLTGVKFEGERKFRLNRLGYDEKKLLDLDKVQTQEEKGLEELQEIRNSKNNPQKAIVRQPLPIEDRIKVMDQEMQRKELQELVNTNRAFEKEHNISRDSKPDTREAAHLQKLRDIREIRGKGIDRSGSWADHDREREDTRDYGTDRGAKDKIDDKDSSKDNHDDDKKSGRDADRDNDDDQRY